MEEKKNGKKKLPQNHQKTTNLTMVPDGKGDNNVEEQQWKWRVVEVERKVDGGLKSESDRGRQ